MARTKQKARMMPRKRRFNTQQIQVSDAHFMYPNDIWVAIFANLGQSSLRALYFVNKKFYSLLHGTPKLYNTLRDAVVDFKGRHIVGTWRVNEYNNHFGKIPLGKNIVDSINKYRAVIHAAKTETWSCTSQYYAKADPENSGRYTDVQMSEMGERWSLHTFAPYGFLLKTWKSSDGHSLYVALSSKNHGTLALDTSDDGIILGPSAGHFFVATMEFRSHADNVEDEFDIVSVREPDDVSPSRVLEEMEHRLVFCLDASFDELEAACPGYVRPPQRDARD